MLSSGCASKQLPTSPESQQHVTLKGVSLSPDSFSQEGFTSFLETAKQAGSIIGWYGDIAELSDTKGAPYVTTELALRQGQLPLIIAQTFEQDSDKLLRPLDEKNKAEYKRAVLQFVDKYKPAYFGIGIEVNILQENSPADFDRFVSFFFFFYSAVKQASPDTKVFTSFQLERLKGLKSGLFGGQDTEPAWEMIYLFKSDLVAFTTYPCLIFPSPADIPDDYYSDILSHVSKPVAFTEIGFNLTKNLDAEFFIWSFLYDQKTSFPFSDMGLFSSNGQKQAWDVWFEGK
ncbi:hypothetical protein HZB90_02660 [archaeon]|nr:hypothetical protein [archaeon]